MLTIERGTQQYDMDVAFGDLDIRESLTILGVNGSTSVGWWAGAAADRLFELVGDYNLSATVDAGDYIIWRVQDGQSGQGLAADGDDDGDVDGDDLTVRNNHFGNTFALSGITVI